MAYTILHTQISARPHWYQLERWDEGHRKQAIRRARNYVLDHGGFVCVKDNDGNVVFGADPAELDRAIASGINRQFEQAA